MKSPILRKFAITIIQLCLVIALVSSPDESSATENQFEVYKQVYPDIDTTHDLTNCSRSDNETCPLYIALMMAFDGDYISSGVIPGVQLALDQINSDPDILPGYTLHYTLLPTRCETYATVALDALHTQLLHPPTKIGIIGSGCSVATEATAQVSHYYNVTHVSCALSSDDLANRTRFPYYYQLHPSEDELVQGFYTIINKFGWRRVFIFLQEERLFESTMNKLMKILKNSQNNTDFEVRIRRFPSSTGVRELGDRPFDSEFRIFILAMYSSNARTLLCEAIQQGIRYPRHLFLLYGWYEDQWWVGSEEEEDRLNLKGCTIKRREAAINHSLAVRDKTFLSDCSSTADSGTNGFKFHEGYENRFYRSRAPPLNLTRQSLYAQHCYDATWTLAKALDRTVREIDNDTSLRQRLSRYEPDIPDQAVDDFNLQHFSYANSGVLDLIFNHLKATNFTGITGTVNFSPSDGIRTHPGLHIHQYRPSYAPERRTLCFHDSATLKYNFDTAELTMRRELIGIVSHPDHKFTLLVDEDTIFPDGVPSDGVPKVNVVLIHPALLSTLVILGIGGIIFAICCMVFNFVFREKRLIRLSSPNLNYMIGVGAVLLYIHVCLFAVTTKDPLTSNIICKLIPWITTIGYSLTYGTIIVKMYRIYYIVQNMFNPRNPSLKDQYLAIAVMGFVLIDLLILTVYIIVDAVGGRLGITLTSNAEGPMSEIGVTGIVVENKFHSCDTLARTIAVGILLGSKAILQVIALIFSLSIRKVKLKGLNDAKFIAICIYINNFLLAVNLVAFFALKHYLNLYAFLFPFCIFCGTTAILALVFGPNMVFLYRDPQGKKMFAKRSFETTLARSITLHNRHTRKGKKKSKKDTELETLRQRVKDLELIMLESTSERDSNRRKDFVRQSIRKGMSLVETDESYLSRDNEQSVDPESHFTVKCSSTDGEDEFSTARRALNGAQEVEAEPNKPVATESQNEREREEEGFPNGAKTVSTE